MKTSSAAVVVLAIAFLAGCERMQHDGPVPGYRDSKLDAFGPAATAEPAPTPSGAPASNASAPGAPQAPDASQRQK